MRSRVRLEIMIAVVAATVAPTPSPAQDHKPADTIVVRTIDGSQIRGRFEDSVLAFSGSAGRLPILTRRIERFDSGGLLLTDRTLLKGAFVALTLRVRSAAGLIPITTKQVSAIERAGASAAAVATTRMEAPRPGAAPPVDRPAEGQGFRPASAYGWYADIGATRTGLAPAMVNTVLGIHLRRDPSRGMGIDGFASDPAQRFPVGPATFVAYQQGIQAAGIHLALLGYVPDILAASFDPKADPMMFEVIYDKRKTDIVKLGLWRPVAEIPMTVQPVPGTPDLFVLTPRRSLVPGRYALYEGESLHQMDVAFGTSLPRQAIARPFLVVDPARTANRSVLDSVLAGIADDERFDDVAATYAASATQVRLALNQMLKDEGDATVASNSAMTFGIAEGVHGGIFKYLDRYYLGFEEIGHDSTRVRVKLMRYLKDVDAGTFSLREERARTRRAADDFLVKLSKAILVPPSQHALVMDEFAKGLAALKRSPQDFPTAATSFRKVVQAEPVNRDGWFNLASAYLGQREGPGLLDAARHLVAIEPMSVYAMRLLANGYQLIGQTDSASTVANRGIRMQLDVRITAIELSKSDATLRGMAQALTVRGETGSTLPPVKVTLNVEFLDEHGTVLGTGEATIPPMYGGQNRPIAVTLKKPGIVSWRYTVKQ